MTTDEMKELIKPELDGLNENELKDMICKLKIENSNLYAKNFFAENENENIMFFVKQLYGEFFQWTVFVSDDRTFDTFSKLREKFRNYLIALGEYDFVRPMEDRINEREYIKQMLETKEKQNTSKLINVCIEPKKKAEKENQDTTEPDELYKSFENTKKTKDVNKAYKVDDISFKMKP